MAKTPTGSPPKGKQTATRRAAAAKAAVTPAKRVAAEQPAPVKRESVPKPVGRKPEAEMPAPEMPVPEKPSNAVAARAETPAMGLDSSQFVAFAGQALQQFSQTMRLQADAWATLSKTWLDMMDSRRK